MNLLLDTHIALWAISGDPRLSKKAENLISDPDNAVYFSSVSVWEVLLKHELPHSNLTISPSDFIQYCEESGYYPLSMSVQHIRMAETLDIPDMEKKHTDPFDRLLIAQAKTENFSLITHDDKIPLYGEKCIISV